MVPVEIKRGGEDANARRIPTLHIVADNIPQAHYRATQAVWNQGKLIRTQYDRKDAAGEYIDPPSRDAKVLIEVVNPFNQPRYPGISFCEIGTYIAEMMGAKDHRVVPAARLREVLSKGEKLTEKEWPYTYPQRLFNYPLPNGETVDQLDAMCNMVAKDFFTRRAVGLTGVPEIDPNLSDPPCLREVQLRGTEEDGIVYVHMDTKWRSRDLFKAWMDNVIAVTFLHQVLTKEIGRKMGRETRVGSYSDYSSSLHIYGQDWDLKSDKSMPFKGYIALSEEEALGKAKSSDDAKESLVVPQLEELLTPRVAKQWAFPKSSINLIKSLIYDLERGELIA